MNILLVDDHVDLAEMFAELLDGLGHNCLIALDAPQAIDSIACNRPELVITEACLPDGDGLDLVRHVRHTLPGTSVIFMSSLPGMEEAARQAGAAAYLRRPFTLEALTRAIDCLPGARPVDRPARSLLGRPIARADRVLHTLGRILWNPFRRPHYSPKRPNARRDPRPM